MAEEIDAEGLPIVPELAADKSNAKDVEEATKQRATKSRQMRETLRKENENLKKGLNADGTAKETPAAEKKEEPKTGELDRVDLAVLRTEGITDAKELALVKSWMKDTGRPLESVLDNKIFKSELKEMRDLAATEDATPDGQKRSGASAKTSVEYWLAKPKGELPADPALRSKVVKARIAQEKSGSMFSATPIQ